MGEEINMRELERQVVASRYRLVEYLAEGAFGAVFRASHEAYDLELRQVAIKIAKRPMSGPEARQIFGEALLTARITAAIPDVNLRQHFVTVHDAGRLPEGSPAAGHPYVVMELIRNGSLKRCLKSRPFPLKRTMDYFDQLLQAVEVMHKGIPDHAGRVQPVIHRDIKPGNILIVRRCHGQDVIKLTDFGLAVKVDTLLGWARSGGDLAYLAPESFSQGISSKKTDVYMLGLVFYEMLTGKCPFDEIGTHLFGDDPKKHEQLKQLHVAARQTEKFSSLGNHEELQGRRKALVPVIRTALAADPDIRHKDAGAFLRAWRQAKTSAAPAPTRTHFWEEARSLTAQARQCFGLDDERGFELLQQAMALNRDPARVPNPMVVGGAYLLMVQQLIARGRMKEAGHLALEGYRRRKCRSTCLAVACYYRTAGPGTEESFEQEAQTCPDRE